MNEFGQQNNETLNRHYARWLVPAVAGAALGWAAIGYLSGAGAVLLGGTGLVAGGITAAIAWIWLRRHVQTPLQHATRQLAQRLEEGGEIRLDVTSRDEIGQLTASVNELMAAAFIGEGEVQGILSTAAEGIITIDSLGLVERANPAALLMFGRTDDEMRGIHIGLLVPSYEQLPISTLNLDLADDQRGIAALPRGGAGHWGQTRTRRYCADSLHAAHASRTAGHSIWHGVGDSVVRAGYRPNSSWLDWVLRETGRIQSATSTLTLLTRSATGWM